MLGGVCEVERGFRVSPHIPVDVSRQLGVEGEEAYEWVNVSGGTHARTHARPPARTLSFSTLG